MRQPTLETLGLGTVLDIFAGGRLPAQAGELVDRVFGTGGDRGSLVISGANGIVGAGKTMQLGSRLQPYGVRIVALDFAGVPDGIGRQYRGLVSAFGREGANKVMENIIQLTYDGKTLPQELRNLKPRFLLEAIPEILDIKKAHYELFRSVFPEIEIRSVTSGFPASQLGVGVAHPAFPHEINKMWEVVEPEPSSVTQLLWALGLIPVAVSDDWSFVLDVLFCGVTLAALRYHQATNMPFWKIDKFVRKHLGPNPLRAHDAIGAKGANFLTWSCLHHLGKEYGAVFTPTPELDQRKETGQNWYPPNHFRPLVDWKLSEAEEDEFKIWIFGPVFQMTSLMLHENRGHLSHLNAIGELCAQFRRGVLAEIRRHGSEATIRLVEKYHKLHPEAAKSAWHPDAFEKLHGMAWKQLYVNAEHDGKTGVITISRESYNHDVDAELNRAIDWLKAESIEHVILTGDFHLSTQMVGADTSEFFPALEQEEKGLEISQSWSQTARRFNDEFQTSVGFVNGKRCLGGMLELLMHCHYFIAVDGADLGFPEVTLPVVPGMEGCHWPFRKATPDNWPKLVRLLLEGRPAKARDAVGWLVDYAGPMDDCLKMVWSIVTGGEHGLAKRQAEKGALGSAPQAPGDLADAGDAATDVARQAIMATVQASCGASLADALSVQAKHSAGFMKTRECQKGMVGATFVKTMKI
jgi:enoyl-CoA hydratase/carnithine racemase